MKFAHVENKLNENTTAAELHKRSKYDGNSSKDATTFGGNPVR